MPVATQIPQIPPDQRTTDGMGHRGHHNALAQAINEVSAKTDENTEHFNDFQEKLQNSSDSEVLFGTDNNFTVQTDGSIDHLETDNGKRLSIQAFKNKITSDLADEVTNRETTDTDLRTDINTVADRTTALESEIDKTVIDEIDQTSNASTVSITNTTINLKTGATSSGATVLPVANETNAGVMNAAMVSGLNQAIATVSSLLNEAFAVSGLIGTPTQQDLADAWLTASGETSLHNGAVLWDIDNQRRFGLFQTSPGDLEWFQTNTDTGQSVTLFTNTAAGIIKGSAADGQVFAETNGTGSVNGWDDLVQQAQTNTAEISAHENDTNNPHTTSVTNLDGATEVGISLMSATDTITARAAIDLGNADNTSDADKPVSTQQQAALDLKLNTADVGNYLNWLAAPVGSSSISATVDDSSGKHIATLTASIDPSASITPGMKLQFTLGSAVYYGYFITVGSSCSISVNTAIDATTAGAISNVNYSAAAAPYNFPPDFTLSPSTGGGIDYSLEEQDTGKKWLDGRKIYQKTFELIATSSGVQNIVHGISNILMAVSFDGVFNTSINASHIDQKTMFYGRDGFNVLVDSVGKTNILVLVNNQVLPVGAKAYITISYTCTDR